MNASWNDELAARLLENLPSFVCHVLWLGTDVRRVHVNFAGRQIDLIELDPASAMAYSSDGVFDCAVIPAPLPMDQYQCILDTAARLISSHGMLWASMPIDYLQGLPVEMEGPLQANRMFIMRMMELLSGNEVRAVFVFARDTYDPFAHASDLAAAGMPARAADVLTWLESYFPLREEQQALVAGEKLRYYRMEAESKPQRLDETGLVSCAQKEFQIAVHRFPLRHEYYRDQAAIWRRFGNDNLAARLLRSIMHVAPDPATRNDLAACKPESTPQPVPETAPDWDGSRRSPRILAITHDHSDYGLDTLYDGLCTVIGSANIREFPWKPTLHGREKEATLKYPCWFEHDGGPVSAERIEQELRDGLFDVILFADMVQMTHRDVVRRFIDAAPDIPVVVYDPWDNAHSLRKQVQDYLGGAPIVAYFKREMLVSFDYGPNSFPLPFGYPDRYVPHSVPASRSRDLFWAGKRIFGTRSLYLDRLARVLERDFTTTYSQDAYARAIREARIGLSFFGFGFDTVRYWELPAHGCMLLAERPPIRIPFDFVDGESAVFFEDLPELEDKLSYYMSRPDEAERIARAGRDRFMRWHTSSARARQFLGRLAELLEW
ncbi:MAG: hypothetical protein AMXMBFR4_33220 [Candidatus Hydrogenedentota bacterium]